MRIELIAFVAGAVLACAIAPSVQADTVISTRIDAVSVTVYRAPDRAAGL